MLAGFSYPKISEKVLSGMAGSQVAAEAIDLQAFRADGAGKDQVAVVRYLGSQFFFFLYEILLSNYHSVLLKLLGSLHCGGPAAGSVCCQCLPVFRVDVSLQQLSLHLIFVMLA